MSDRDYCYPPDYTVLRNRLDIRDAPALEAAERELVAQRLPEPVPAGDFDHAHLKAIHRRIVAAGYFAGLRPDGFAGGAGPVLGDVNHVHPFREGNGHTQLQYLKQLAARAGNVLDLTRLDRPAWLDASRRFNTGDHAAMTRCVRNALT